MISFRDKQSLGRDQIPSFLSKICADTLAMPLSYIDNLLFKKGVHPATWKEARICPIRKNGNKEIISNYRPILIRSNFSELFESYMVKFISATIKLNVLEIEHGFVTDTGNLVALLQNFLLNRKHYVQDI